MNNDLPKTTQEFITFIDSTPDKEYPLRILKAYRENCNCKWCDSSTEEVISNPLLQLMNKHCDQRAKILDEAIMLLEEHLKTTCECDHCKSTE
jgi:hypothetical protein